MLITINPEPFIIVSVDMNVFRETLKKSLSIKEALKISHKIISRERLTEEEVFSGLYYCLNWGEIIDYFGDIKKNVMKVLFCDCIINGRITYEPGIRNASGTTFLFTKNEYSESQETILVQSFVGTPDANLDNLIKVGIYDYSKKVWEVMPDDTITIE